MAKKKGGAPKRKPTSKSRSKVTRRGAAQRSTTAQRKLAKLTAKLWSDPEWKAKFSANPREGLVESGFDIPEDVNVKVVEDTPDTFHFIIRNPTTGAKIEKLYHVMGKSSGSATGCHCHKKGPHKG